MTRRDDVLEQRQDLPLFAPRVRELAHVTGPHTSVKAAAKVIADGTADDDARLLLWLIKRFPGETMREHGNYCANTIDRPLTAQEWRVKLTRRTGTLVASKQAHAKGERYGFQRWWPGRDPEAP